MTSVKSELLKRILKRRSFSGLMDLYEINYGLLNRLAPNLSSINGAVISQAARSPDLHLTIEERCPFTTTLCLTYYFQEADGVAVADPDLQVRLYHDARQAEAMVCRQGGVLPRLEQHNLTMLECKWDSNLFLEKWLRYALSQGHRFEARNQDGDRMNPTREPPLTVS